MRDYPFDFNQLKNFSESAPYTQIEDTYLELFHSLKNLESKYNFPAINDDVGSFINFFFKWLQPKRIFEFGSGYGQSAFWYLLGNSTIEKVILTEKRDDLVDEFNSLKWPEIWRSKLDYHQEDAFDVFKKTNNFDFILIDGVKADYLDFLKLCHEKLSANGVILIDNSYWRGSFLDDEVVAKKKTAKRIRELHAFICETNLYESVFIPFEDGVSLLRKKSF